MILFQKDWLRYPNAIMDYNTTNRFAVDLALKFRQAGVKNYGFFLALHDKSLQGVDPYDPNLTAEQMVKIGMEIRINPWYFFREVARAPAMAGTVPGRVEFNRANISMWWSFFNHCTYILIQPRQTGKSFCTDLLMNLLTGFYCSNTQINLMTKDDKLRTENVKRMKAIYEELPVYLNLKSKEDANNTEEISIRALGNFYLTHVPQSSEKRANNMGRGLSTPILHIDEGPFQTFIKTAFEAATGAMGAAIAAAKRNNEPYGIIMTTTAGKKDDRDGRFVYDYAMEAARWSEKFYDSEDEPSLEAMVKKHSKAPDGGVYRIYGAFSYKQLGKTDEWMRGELQRARSAGSGGSDSANRDYFNVWTSGSQSAPLPVHLLDALTANIQDAVCETISPIGGYITRWYLPEEEIENYMETHKTVAGIDTSDAVGKDGISFVLVDVLTGDTVAVSEFNETNLILFAQWLTDFMVRFKNSTVVIERRSSGPTIIDYMHMFLPPQGVDPYKRMFNWVVNDHLLHQDKYAEAQMSLTRRENDVYVRAKKYFGFATSGGGDTARSELYSTTLKNAVTRCLDKVKDRALTEQITSLENRSGRVDHPVGGHDDLVIGWLMCHWFLSMGKNLQFYGIDPRSVMINSKPKETLTVSQAYYEDEQWSFRERIDELFELMREETDGFIIGRYEQELRYLDSRLILKDGETFSIDAEMEKMKETKKKQRMAANGFQVRGYYESLGYGTAPTVDGLSGGAFGMGGNYGSVPMPSYMH